MIHADAHLHNVFVDEDRTVLIDFDDCGFGWYAYELAVAGHPSRHKDWYADGHSVLGRENVYLPEIGLSVELQPINGNGSPGVSGIANEFAPVKLRSPWEIASEAPQGLQVLGESAEVRRIGRRRGGINFPLNDHSTAGAGGAAAIKEGSTENIRLVWGETPSPSYGDGTSSSSGRHRIPRVYSGVQVGRKVVDKPAIRNCERGFHVFIDQDCTPAIGNPVDDVQPSDEDLIVLGGCI